MNDTRFPDKTPLAQLERLIVRMQKIQRDLHASGQPASLFEIGRLKDLGHEYAEITARLEADGRPGNITHK
jgi:hypothetical protein